MHDAGTACWSWHAEGRSIGWVRRRQAHEALIHRVDAELAAGDRTPLPGDLAADGVDEILRFMLDVHPLQPWAVFEPDGTTAVIALDDGSPSWAMSLGRFRGTSPTSGNTYDLAALELVDDGVADPHAVIRGEAADIDLWLWGRGAVDRLRVEGDPGVADRIRETAAESTQ
jgi:hypothetical protein